MPITSRLVYKSFSILRMDRLVWATKHQSLRILCYHGVCPDEFLRDPWMPEYFVPASLFERQLDYLRTNCEVLPLSTAVGMLFSGSLPRCAVSITFDDGYANNLSIACPILAKFEMPATIFVTTGYADSQDLFPFLKLRLLRLAGLVSSAEASNYKLMSLDSVQAYLEPQWRALLPTLTSSQHQMLRPMSRQELQSLPSRLIDLGAHGHTHCILGRETEVRRRDEICTSVQTLTSWIGKPVVAFSYPNGQIGDFDDFDKNILKQQGIRFAVSGVSGDNLAQGDSFALHRYPVGLYHDSVTFPAEVTGFRSFVQGIASGVRR